MTEAKTFENMSPGLSRVMDRARRNPHERQLSLAYLIDVEALKRAYGRIRKNAAVGVDGITKEQYGQDLQRNLENLHQRLKKMKYRHQPIARVHIPKDKGQKRPIGISCLEDKIVQKAVAKILNVVYDYNFYGFSHGFREGHSQHMALHELREQCRKQNVNWIIDADVCGYFDNIDKKLLVNIIKQRVNDAASKAFIDVALTVDDAKKIYESLKDMFENEE